MIFFAYVLELIALGLGLLLELLLFLVQILAFLQILLLLTNVLLMNLLLLSPVSSSDLGLVSVFLSWLDISAWNFSLLFLLLFLLLLQSLLILSSLSLTELFLFLSILFHYLFEKFLGLMKYLNIWE